MLNTGPMHYIWYIEILIKMTNFWLLLFILSAKANAKIPWVKQYTINQLNRQWTLSTSVIHYVCIQMMIEKNEEIQSQSLSTTPSGLREEPGSKIGLRLSIPAAFKTWTKHKIQAAHNRVSWLSGISQAESFRNQRYWIISE